MIAFATTFTAFERHVFLLDCILLDVSEQHSGHLAVLVQGDLLGVATLLLITFLRREIHVLDILSFNTKLARTRIAINGIHDN